MGLGDLADNDQMLLSLLVLLVNDRNIGSYRSIKTSCNIRCGFASPLGQAPRMRITTVHLKRLHKRQRLHYRRSN
jgi:hypothetical protein